MFKGGKLVLLPKHTHAVTLYSTPVFPRVNVVLFIYFTGLYLYTYKYLQVKIKQKELILVKKNSNEFWKFTLFNFNDI